MTLVHARVLKKSVLVVVVVLELKLCYHGNVTSHLLPTVLAGSIQTMNKCSYFNLAVASFLEGRQGDQCMHRYTQTLQMVRKGKWTEEEDEVIPGKKESPQMHFSL